MNSYILTNEVTLRLAFFASIFILIALWEALAPRRRLRESKWRRWASNFGLVLVDNLILRVSFPVLAVGLASLAGENRWGVLNILGISPLPNLVLSLILFDFIIYLQHVIFHMIPVFWRLHRVHHADLDYDVTTASRFHPFEIILSMVIKLAAILAIGPSAVAIIIFEIILNGSSMFNHGNIRLSARLDTVIRLLVVTPDMHRIHHSIYPSETNSNYGFFLSIWDRFMGTYREQPKEGHADMRIGLAYFRERKYMDIHWLVLLPFLSDKRR